MMDSGISDSFSPDAFSVLRRYWLSVVVTLQYVYHSVFHKVIILGASGTFLAATRLAQNGNGELGGHAEPDIEKELFPDLFYRFEPFGLGLLYVHMNHLWVPSPCHAQLHDLDACPCAQLRLRLLAL